MTKDGTAATKPSRIKAKFLCTMLSACAASRSAAGRERSTKERMKMVVIESADTTHQMHQAWRTKASTPVKYAAERNPTPEIKLTPYSVQRAGETGSRGWMKTKST